MPTIQEQDEISDDMGDDDDDAGERKSTIGGTKIIFKVDMVTRDIMILRLFEMLNLLWRSSGIGEWYPVAKTYSVVALAPDIGIIELIEHTKQMEGFDWNSLRSMDSNGRMDLVRTAVGAFVGAEVQRNPVTAD